MDSYGDGDDGDDDGDDRDGFCLFRWDVIRYKQYIVR